ncbi:MAG TPA: efflux RND transporter periplasmic adaptor subunit, partial [Polyangia bacterium]
MDADKTPDSEPPEPRRPSRRLGVVAFAFTLVGAVLGGTGVWVTMHRHENDGPHPAGDKAAKKAPLYQCPMHPSITSDHPGNCPICGMKLVPVASAATDNTVGNPGPRKIVAYRSPMNSKQISTVPRKDEMGMDYLPVYEDEGGGAQSVQGLAPVTIDPSRQQLIGLRTAPVTKGSAGATWHTVGRIQVDPTHVRKTNVKIDGFVEKIYVDYLGQSVRKGQPLFSIYSPSLLAAQNEYLLALQTSDALAKGGGHPVNGDTLVVSARRRLELWDVPAGEIERLTRTRQPTKTLTLVSPIGGVVTAKNVVQGARVTPGEAPYEITDLSSVWLMADAYESDLSRIHLGMKAT